MADYIYLVKQGEFKSIKRVPLTNQTQNKDLNLSQLIKKDYSSDRKEQSKIDIDNFKKQENLNKY